MLVIASPAHAKLKDDVRSRVEVAYAAPTHTDIVQLRLVQQLVEVEIQHFQRRCGILFTGQNRVNSGEVKRRYLIVLLVR